MMGGADIENTYKPMQDAHNVYPLCESCASRQPLDGWMDSLRHRTIGSMMQWINHSPFATTCLQKLHTY